VSNYTSAETGITPSRPSQIRRPENHHLNEAFILSQALTLDASISATAILAEIAEELVRTVLADHPDENIISLLAISVSHLEEHWDVQLELPLGLEDEEHRPGTKKGMARWMADRAVDRIRNRFGWEAVGYGSVALGLSRSVPDEFRELPKRICNDGRKALCAAARDRCRRPPVDARPPLRTIRTSGWEAKAPPATNHHSEAHSTLFGSCLAACVCASGGDVGNPA
jgi:hypothetical protein